jgi:pimeloyl-ACP methyl ester carboxylesterase
MHNQSKPRKLLRYLGRSFGWVLFLLCLIAIGWILGSRLRIERVEKFTPRQAAPANGRWVYAHDVNVYLQEFGPPQGKPLVLVHGTGAWSGTWGSNIPAMVQAGYHVIAIDLPPFGFSERVQAMDYSRKAQAKRILAVIENLKITSATLLGHSFGGGPAAEAVMLDSRRISHLVLVDAAIGLQTTPSKKCEPPSLPVSLLGWRPLRTALISSAGTNPLFSEYLLRKFVARKEVVTAERTAIYQAPFVTHDFTASLGDWAWQFATGCEEQSSATQAGFKSISIPVSLVWGDEDTITPMAQAQQLHQLISVSRLTVLKAVGHIPQIENVVLFNTSIIEVLNNQPSLILNASQTIKN